MTEAEPVSDVNSPAAVTNQSPATSIVTTESPEPEKNHIVETNVDRKSFYFVDETKGSENDERHLHEITKRYKHLLDLSHLFKTFIQSRAKKDPKFKQVIAKVEETLHKSILNDDDVNKKSGKFTGSEGVRRRKTEKEEDAELLGSSNDSDIIEFTESPSYINGKLREYQIQGLNWLVSLHENNLSGILADEMGLGKTLQTISFLGYLRFFKGIVGPHLVIVPKSTLENWQREFGKWIPQFNTVVLTGDKTQRADIINQKIMSCDFDVVISSYELVIKEKATLKKIEWSYIVIDEAHRIKNEQSLLSQVIRLFTSRNRLLITGTPLQNNLHELWALLNFILPDVFSDSESFDEYFGATNAENDQDHDQDQQEVIKQLHTILSPFLLRRIKSQVEKSLLPKKEMNLYVSLSPLQKKLYRKLLEKDLDAVNGLNGKKESKTRLLNIVMQLRKCSNHPYLFDGVEPGPPYTTDEHLVFNSQKLKVLDNLLKKFKAEGSRVLIFSQMSRMLDIMEDYCYFRGYGYCRIDGSTDHEDRIQQIDEYNAEGSDKFIFLLTTRAGGLGINLTSADVVVLYDSDWNPQADLQAMDRAHRIGQKKQVKVFRMVTENTIEEKVLERAMKKLRLDQVVIQQARASSANQQVDKDELLNMIRYGAHDMFNNSAGQPKDSDEDGDAGDEINLDDLLANSEKRTKELNSKYAKLGFDELQDLEAENTSAYQWNGTDFKKQNTKKIGSGFMWLNPGKRERKENYSIDGYYRDVLNSGGRPASTEPKGPKAPKQMTLYDHQFYSPNLFTLHEKEKYWYRKQINYKVPLNQKPQSNGGTGNTKSALSAEDIKLDNKLEQIEVDHATALTEEEEKLKEEYLKEGYGNWSRREFNHFISASAKHGRHNIDLVANEMIENNVVMTVKTFDEIKEYSETFWNRYTEIEGFERYIMQIEQGEEKIAKQIKQRSSLHKKISQYESPLNELELKFPPTSTSFTPDEDAFLLVMLFKHGIDSDGIYETIHKEILKSNIFKFDYFLKSRTSTELNRRCNALLAAVVKEVESNEQQVLTILTKKRKALDDKKKNRTNKRKKVSIKKLSLKSSVSLRSKKKKDEPKKSAPKRGAAKKKVTSKTDSASGAKRNKPGPKPGAKYKKKPGPKPGTKGNSKAKSNGDISSYFNKKS
ncbi:chromatin-remodeling ATPase [Saccharomycopsis crataegensis]|uniref:Chromatin-remodeling ATPase n=1 Tax=Saccharomycopsis crataegensis TaxID=43959 RepID=A0AAV5QUD3_9ASCO|nr:chromatin-remodeling ATPase [Saccharomycopsis crataegensis]